ncbi:MAG: ion channel [Leptolyngbyaceae cyanobacterium]
MPFKPSRRSIASRLLVFQQSETKFFYILAALLLLIVCNPILPTQGLGAYTVKLLLTFVILSGIVAASSERQIILQMMALGLLTLLLDWWSLLGPQFPQLALIAFASYCLFVALVTVSIIIQIAQSDRVTGNVLCGAIAGYLLIGLTGTFLAILLELAHPGAFVAGGVTLARADLFNALMYYSLVTLSTIGYGDITPAVPAARSLSLLLGLSGQIYLTVLIALLVGKYLNDTRLK